MLQGYVGVLLEITVFEILSCYFNFILFHTVSYWFSWFEFAYSFLASTAWSQLLRRRSCVIVFILDEMLDDVG